MQAGGKEFKYFEYVTHSYLYIHKTTYSPYLYLLIIP